MLMAASKTLLNCTVKCPYNTTFDDKTSTTHFLVPFCILIWKFSLKFFWTYFFVCWVTFEPPFDEKYKKVAQKQFLVAQKKRLDALNATQKTKAPNNVRFLKKSRKTSKKYPFLPKRQKMAIFESILKKK